MLRRICIAFVLLLVAWGSLTWLLGTRILPPILLDVPMPVRSEEDRKAVRDRLGVDGGRWTSVAIPGGQGRALEVWRLHRSRSRGVVVYLHGFGDDAWGTLGRAADLPDRDAVGFTFRGRDRRPEVPCTLGAWERVDLVSVVRWLEQEGVPRSRIVIAAWSMGAGTALLALSDLETRGEPLGGALLECPFASMAEAARDHIRLKVGGFEWLLRPAERIALAQAGRLAGFDPQAVDAVRASRGLRTPIALLTGDADLETPLAGVQAIAQNHPDLTVVPGAGHCQAGGRLKEGWGGWAEARLRRW